MELSPPDASVKAVAPLTLLAAVGESFSALLVGVEVCLVEGCEDVMVAVVTGEAVREETNLSVAAVDTVGVEETTVVEETVGVVDRKPDVWVDTIVVMVDDTVNVVRLCVLVVLTWRDVVGSGLESERRPVNLIRKATLRRENAGWQEKSVLFKSISCNSKQSIAQ